MKRQGQGQGPCGSARLSCALFLQLLMHVRWPPGGDDRTGPELRRRVDPHYGLWARLTVKIRAQGPPRPALPLGEGRGEAIVNRCSRDGTSCFTLSLWERAGVRVFLHDNRVSMPRDDTGVMKGWAMCRTRGMAVGSGSYRRNRNCARVKIAFRLVQDVAMVAARPADSHRYSRCSSSFSRMRRLPGSTRANQCSRL